MGEEGEHGGKKRVVVESLGWLTESSIMPKKQRSIAGVGPSSILELKAQLYRSQEESKRLAKDIVHRNSDQHLEIHRAKQKISAHDPFSVKNSGVDSRAAKDKLELKAVKDGSASYAALEKKAALYDKLARGELSDEEEKEKYCVDFFRKNMENDHSQPQGHETSAKEPQELDGEEDKKPVGLGRASATIDSSEHKRFVWEVHEEANQAREKASDLKLKRQEQVAAHREKLKLAYLQKQLQKLKAESKTE